MRALLFAVAVVLAQSSTTFYPASDPDKDITAALAAAQTDGKHVILDFGADWCPDCRVLGALFEDASVAPLARDNFHVVRIDVGRRDKNGDVAKKYSATSDDWIPAVVVLDAEGTIVARTDDHVRLTRRTTPAELSDLLRQWAPKRRVADLSSFVERGVRVTLGLDRDRSRRAWLAATFSPLGANTHMYSIDLPADGIDGLGRPTRVEILSGSGLRATGPAVADRPVIDDRIDALGVVLPVYPSGPVTVRIPVELAATTSRASVSVSYMACGLQGCLPPVRDRRIPITVDR